MAKPVYFSIANAVAFQAGWFICLLAPVAWALLYTALFTVVHFRILKPEARCADALAVAVAMALGFIHDTALLQTGVLSDSASAQPIWLTCLWLMLGLTLRHSLWPIYSRPWLASLVGAVAAGLSYTAGIALSDVSWGEFGPRGAFVIAVIWLLVLPAHKAITDSFNVMRYAKGR
ncbi:DUF2878 domain-containing protein [Gilvimarinus chinensis]|uniref:DUF2878 domain-containing protein n=1 Tax=Gilvimarinus chinensis TaxID=396005 RepID=UPI000381E3C1|nr:DUF2878 domain-containing protein [Gilvimarinus chinensis]